MRIRINNPGKIARVATLATLYFMVFWETLLLLFPLKPFWRDEWCIIYNLKFKTAAMLWGPLDFTQQFPRVYLQILKYFTSLLDYSYCSLRLPSYLTGMAALLLCWQLMKRLYPQREDVNKYLFVLIVVSYQVFMDYFVQIKQYEMEMLLSLVAIWQLMELLQLPVRGMANAWKYLLLCLSFFAAPFFSYTYPIAIAPVFVIVFMQGVHLVKNRSSVLFSWKRTLQQWFPLLIGAGSVVIFYIIDVSQLMADNKMHAYWEQRMMNRGFSAGSFFEHTWMLFSKVGPGAVVGILFGVLGLFSFCYGVYRHIVNNKERYNENELVRLYCTLLVLFSLLLFISGKLPLGEPKFNAFTVPAVAVIIVFFLDKLSNTLVIRKFAFGLAVFIFVALSGNIFAGFFNNFTSSVYQKRIHIYTSTQNAINVARDQKIPLFVTPDIGFPDDITVVIPNITMPTAAGVVKTFPAYKKEDSIAVYDIESMGDIALWKQQLTGVKKVVVGDGGNYRVVNW